MPKALLHLVAPASPIGLGDVCVVSFRAARMQSRGGAIPMTAASAAGLALLIAGGDARLALSRVEGSDDWSVMVRGTLRHVAEEAERASAVVRRSR